MPPTSIDPRKALGLRIKQLRAEYQLTQEELADRCCLFRTYMSRIESGLANPTLTALHTLAKGFRIDISELLVMPDAKAIAKPMPKVRAAKPISRGRVAR